jgi:acyl-CoA reductase-like NAD-dependent aldehyde dehydrogenase
MVLKPSENSPSSAQILTEIIDEAGLPPGVFNLIQGDGAEVGPSLSGHPLVDMVSLTGSHRAGSSVSKHAADTIKRVSLELGGKSANIILQDADLESAVQAGVAGMMLNTGQSCNAPSRMFVHKSQLATVEKMTIDALASVVVGDPLDPQTTMGPIANQRQYLRVQSLIEDGIKQGAKLVAGGVGRPDGIETGFFVKPTIFSEATNDMNIAREEIFGPVLTIIPYESEDEVIKMANDTEYGLSGYVSAGTTERAKEFALQLRTGMVHLNCAPFDINAPFGGYKQSGIGREWGSAGFDEFLETKAIMSS